LPPPSGQKYLVDTDVLVHIRSRPDAEAIYAAIADGATAGWVRTVKQVPDEVQRHAPAYAEIKPIKKNLIVPAEEQYCEEVRSVNELVQDLAPLLFEQVGGKNPDPADPWLIAVAKVHGYTLVTDENPRAVSRIPAVCKLPQIACRCITGPHFLIETGIITHIDPAHIEPHAFFGL